MVPTEGIIVIDDPFAALDASTGLDVFEDVLLNKMAHLTCVLITHQVQFLGRCDRVIWMEEGQIKAVGPFDELMAAEEGFRLFIGEKTESTPRMAAEGASGVDSKMPTYFEGEGHMEEEELHSKPTPWRALGSYINVSSMWWYLIVVFLIYLISQVVNVLYNVLYAW